MLKKCNMLYRASVVASRRFGGASNRSSPSFSFQRMGQRWLSSTTSSGSGSDAPLLSSLDETNGILTLTLNRPDQRNALSVELLEQLRYQLGQLSHPNSSDDNDNVRVVVLQSQGSVFCSGHDLKELQAMDSSQQKDLFQLSSMVMQAMPEIPQPTIAAVQGLATAAGCQLAAACDLVIASPMSGFSAPGVDKGFFCHTPGVELVRAIGHKRALDMLLTGRTLLADEALQYGLVSRLAGNPQKEANKIAMELSSKSTSAVQYGKEIFYRQSSASATKEDAYQIASQAMVTNLQMEDAKHGIESFLTKTKADFKKKQKPPTYTQWQEFGRQQNL